MLAADIRALLLAPWKHGDCVDLQGVTCEGQLDLSDSQVTGFNLTGAQFPDGINARGAQFLGLAWLHDTQIDALADFSRSLFLIDAGFERAQFGCPAQFHDCELRGVGRFDNAVFQSGADFRNCIAYGNFSLQQAQVQGRTQFQNAEWLGGLWCERMALSEQTDFSDSQVHGRLWLRQARIGNAPLSDAQFPLSFGYTYS